LRNERVPNHPALNVENGSKRLHGDGI